MAKSTLPVYLRPLTIIALDDQLPVNISHEPGELALQLLSELTADQAPLDLVRKRYREVTNDAQEPIVVPQ